MAFGAFFFFTFVIVITQCRVNLRREPLQPKVLIPFLTATPSFLMLADETHKYVVNAKQLGAYKEAKRRLVERIVLWVPI